LDYYFKLVQSWTRWSWI